MIFFQNIDNLLKIIIFNLELHPILQFRSEVFLFKLYNFDNKNAGRMWPTLSHMCDYILKNSPVKNMFEGVFVGK